MLVFWPKSHDVDQLPASRRLGVLCMVLLVVAGAGWLAQTVIPVPPLLVGYGRFAARQLNDHGKFLYVGEGMNSSMTVSVLPNDVLSYHPEGLFIGSPQQLNRLRARIE